MSRAHLGVLLLAALLAYTWHVTNADPFIPIGSNPGGQNNEATLSKVRTGFVWRAPSLLYINLAIPNASFPNNESLWLSRQKAIFFPPVDKLTRLTIPGTFAQFAVPSSPDTASPVIWASGFGFNSTKKLYYRNTGSSLHTVGAYQLVVEMDRGNVTALTWIDGCGECPCTGDENGDVCAAQSQRYDSACLWKNCAINLGDCTKIRPDQCDIKIFVAWVGTDARGRPCTSAGSLPYNFVQFGLSPAYRAAAGVDPQYIFNLPNFGSKKPTA